MDIKYSKLPTYKEVIVEMLDAPNHPQHTVPNSNGNKETTTEDEIHYKFNWYHSGFFLLCIGAFIGVLYILHFYFSEVKVNVGDKDSRIHCFFVSHFLILNSFE